MAETNSIVLNPFESELTTMFNAGIPVTWILGSGDEQRCQTSLLRCRDRSIEKGGLPPTAGVFAWSITGALSECTSAEHPSTRPRGEEFRQSEVKLPNLLQHIIDTPWEGFFFLKDMGTVLNAPEQLTLRRQLIHMIQEDTLISSSRNKAIYLFHTEPPISAIKEHVRVVEMPHPTADELRQVIRLTSQSPRLPDEPEFHARVSRSLTGLHLGECWKIAGIATSVSRDESEFFNRLSSEKGKSLKNTEGLTYTPYDRLPDPEDLAGYDNFIEWMEMRKPAYEPEAEAMGIPYPKGVLLAGMPGTGKSVMSKAGAKLLGLDLVELDFGSLFGSLVGQSESRLRNALKAIEAMGNVYVCIDEIDRALGGLDKGSSSDGGTGSRMLGHLLTWMADRNRSSRENKTFVMATANRLDILPPPLIRAGRFDKIFYTDLPTPDEMYAILCVHLKKRGLDPQAYGEVQLKDILRASTGVSGYTGAEISQAVDDAVVRAFHRDRSEYKQPTASDLRLALSQIVPITKTMHEEIKIMRDAVTRHGLTPVTSGRLSEVQEQRSNNQRQVRVGGRPENN